MPELTWIQWTGVGGVAVVLVGWLTVSLRGTGAGRDRAAWLGTLGIYLALLSLFVGLFLRSHAAGSLPGRIAFGFLASFFAAGLVLCVLRVVRAFRRGQQAASPHAVH